MQHSFLAVMSQLASSVLVDATSAQSVVFHTTIS